MVIGAESKVSIDVMKKYENVYLTVDGQEAFELEDMDKISITMAYLKCKLIKFEDYDYFNVLRKKITSRTKISEL